LAAPRSDVRLGIGLPVFESLRFRTHVCLEALLNRLRDTLPGALIRCFYHQASDVRQCREAIAKRFMATPELSELLWLDSDMTFPADIYEKLSRTGGDIVGALAVRRHQDFPLPAIAIRRNGKWYAIRAWPSRPFEVDGIGLGVTLVKRRVFEKLEPPWFKTPEDESEDYTFCRRAKEAGFHVFCEPRIRVGHIGFYEYTVDDWHAFKRRVPADELAKHTVVAT